MDVAELHLLVPAAEELDLLEVHAEQRQRRAFADLFGPGGPLDDGDLVDLPAPPAAEVAAAAPPTPTHAQAVAIVQRYLGGTVIG